MCTTWQFTPTGICTKLLTSRHWRSFNGLGAAAEQWKDWVARGGWKLSNGSALQLRFFGNGHDWWATAVRFFSLWLVAVAVGGTLLVSGLAKSEGLTRAGKASCAESIDICTECRNRHLECLSICSKGLDDAVSKRPGNDDQRRDLQDSSASQASMCLAF